jgi:hypothetical protein
MRSLRPTEQLIADLLAGGGELRVPEWTREGEPDYRQLVLSAQRWGKVPSGKRLVLSRDAGELVIRFEEAIGRWCRSVWSIESFGKGSFTYFRDTVQA